jgi:putative ABC transport system substrate-binding protein
MLPAWYRSFHKAALAQEGHMPGTIGRRELIAGLFGAVATWPLGALAQPAGKKYTIGYLSAGSLVLVEATAAFTDALRELGWIEGKNVAFERRYAENRLERLAEFAAELVHLNVDVIVVEGTLAPLAAKRATSTIPIVMAVAGDPLGSGLVESLARPGGNVTGMSLMAPDLGGKRLELLKELLPRLGRVAVLWNATNRYAALVYKQTQAAGRTLGIEVQSLEVRGPDDFDGAFATARQQHSDALITVEDPLTGSYRERIMHFAAVDRLPSLHGLREEVVAGGLISYGANFEDLFRRAAGYVDKILRGVKPADLPVQQPTKFELVINLKTAKAFGLQVPPSLLARADEVIE